MQFLAKCPNLRNLRLRIHVGDKTKAELKRLPMIATHRLSRIPALPSLKRLQVEVVEVVDWEASLVFNIAHTLSRWFRREFENTGRDSDDVDITVARNGWIHEDDEEWEACMWAD